MKEGIVLLVDDSPEDRDLMLRAFEEIHFDQRVVTLPDGQEALDYLFGVQAYAGRDKKDAPMMLVLDLRMPRVGGLDVLRRLRADPWLRYVPAIVLTSSDEERDKLEAEKLGVGASMYFNKPADFTGFVRMAQRISGLLAHHRR